MRSDRPVIGRRLFHGAPLGTNVVLGERNSLLIVGPTQVGKTSSLVVPSILNWTGPLVVTSVKRDVVVLTSRWRASLGEVQVLDPGSDAGLSWNPMEGVTSLRHAIRVARDFTSSASGHGDTEFWNTLATKLVASLLVTAHQRSLTIFDVAGVVEDREFRQWSDASPSGDAREMLRSFLDHDPKTLDGVATTAETMLLPWRFEQPLASIRTVVRGPNTLYLCSPLGEQRHYEALFRGAVRMVLDEQQRLVGEGRQNRLLLVLDEAASVAPLEELDQLAATVSGLDVTLVTVVQDFAQLSARWGQRAPTIVNNHSTRVVMGGLADATVKSYLPELVEQESRAGAVPLRRRPPGTAVVVAGSKPPVVVRVRPWWRQRRLRHRATRGVTTMP